MMQRRQALRWSIGLLAAGVGAGTSVVAYANANVSTNASAGMPLLRRGHDASHKPEPLVWRERALLGFGTTLWIKAGHANANKLEAALSAAVRAIRDVEKQMSLFDPDSALCRLNETGKLHAPPPHLLAVLRHTQTVSKASDGIFDASTQPLWTLWSQATAQGSLPSAALLARTRQRVNWRAIEVSPSLLRLNLNDMQLSLNGIAQGYASDLVRQVLISHGIRDAMIDTGENALLGHAPEGRTWSLAIENVAHGAAEKQDMPIQVPEGYAVATSSDAHTAFSADRSHHHILDPRTGDSPGWWSSATVIAASCTRADALTKVFFMTPPDQVAALARRWQVQAILQDKQGRWLRTG